MGNSRSEFEDTAPLPGGLPTELISPLDVDLSAERLLGAIDAACEPAAGFTAQLDAGLGAALALFAAEPALIHSLTARPVSKPVLARQLSCREACAARLRAAAERTPDLEGHPPFVEPFLVAAIQFQLTRALGEGETDRLPESGPDLRNFILAYYADPGQRTL
jgi:hypothetical protein